MKRLVFAAFVLLSGCTVQHEVPAADRALDMADRFVKTCPKMDIPPMPQQVTLIVDGQTILDIDGDQIKATEAGEKFLRGYVRARQFLR